MANMNSTPRFAVEACANGVRFKVTGQTARALSALVAAGPKGITALEMASWALRLAAYVHDLRKLGLVVETKQEAHTGPDGESWHGRYVLHTPVTIERIKYGNTSAPACFDE